MKLALLSLIILTTSVFAGPCDVRFSFTEESGDPKHFKVSGQIGEKPFAYNDDEGRIVMLLTMGRILNTNNLQNTAVVPETGGPIIFPLRAKEDLLKGLELYNSVAPQASKMDQNLVKLIQDIQPDGKISRANWNKFARIYSIHQKNRWNREMLDERAIRKESANPDAAIVGDTINGFLDLQNNGKTISKMRYHQFCDADITINHPLHIAGLCSIIHSELDEETETQEVNASFNNTCLGKYAFEKSGSSGSQGTERSPQVRGQ